MPRRTKEEAERTRLRILEAAVDTFFENGVAKATLNDIAIRAQVTRGAIYWHFKNKLDVFAALHEQLHQSVSDTILEDLENDHPHPLLQLERLSTDLLRDLENDVGRFKILTIFFLKCDYSDEMLSILQYQNKNRREGIELFSRYFQRAKQHGHLAADVEPQVLSVALMAYLTGMVYEYLTDPDAMAMKTEASKYTRLFFRNIG
ncbi:TetR family transcriptional regulator [Pseudohongiella sp. O18]|uniref:TetR family transcriptional regulator n=1 Tax=Pseudohongiella sp. O18 TaxID=2904248 RepID=UPI001F008020|nr:TetR family transcriptional regulator [Pseudohongiella sp. O18]